MRYNNFSFNGIHYRRLREVMVDYMKTNFILYSVPIYISPYILKERNELCYDIFTSLEHDFEIPKNKTVFFYYDRRDDVCNLHPGYKTFAFNNSGLMLKMFRGMLKMGETADIMNGECFLIFESQAEYLKFKIKNG